MHYLPSTSISSWSCIFHRNLYTSRHKEKKLNSALFRICTYRNIQMKINVGLRVNILCIISWLYDFWLLLLFVWQLSKVGSCLTGNLMVSSFDLKNIAKTQLEELLQWGWRGRERYWYFSSCFNAVWFPRKENRDNHIEYLKSIPAQWPSKK